LNLVVVKLQISWRLILEAFKSSFLKGLTRIQVSFSPR
jgi:hypothetical protein